MSREEEVGKRVLKRLEEIPKEMERTKIGRDEILDDMPSSRYEAIEARRRVRNLSAHMGNLERERMLLEKFVPGRRSR